MSTYFLHCYLAGLQYYEVLEVWKKLEKGQTLELISEPDNRYDEHAVIVAYKGKKLGYLPRSQNQTVSKILQAGHDAYEARIQSLYTQNPMYERIEICLKVKGKKNLLVSGQEAIQMFSQRNNTYCESLLIVFKYIKIIYL